MKINGLRTIVISSYYPNDLTGVRLKAIEIFGEKMISVTIKAPYNSKLETFIISPDGSEFSDQFDLKRRQFLKYLNEFKNKDNINSIRWIECIY